MSPPFQGLPSHRRPPPPRSPSHTAATAGPCGPLPRHLPAESEVFAPVPKRCTSYAIVAYCGGTRRFTNLMFLTACPLRAESTHSTLAEVRVEEGRRRCLRRLCQLW